LFASPGQKRKKSEGGRNREPRTQTADGLTLSLLEREKKDCHFEFAIRRGGSSCDLARPPEKKKKELLLGGRPSAWRLARIKKGGRISYRFLPGR